MATIPSFEAVLLEVHQSLEMDSYPTKIKNKFVDLGLEQENHNKKFEEILDAIFCAVDLDEHARHDAMANMMDWEFFHKLLEMNTWTRAADQRQVLWHLLGYSYVPGLARFMANWNLDGAIDEGMPGGQSWFLPQVDTATKKMNFPVGQVVEWLMDLMGLPMDQAKVGLGGKAHTDVDSIERNLYYWRNDGQVPHAKKIKEYFHDGAKTEFRGVFETASGLTEVAIFNAALDFVRRKSLNAEALRAQIPMTKPGRLESILDGSASDEEKQTFVHCLQTRYAKPSMRTIRQRLLVARMVQDGYGRLLKFLYPGVARTCTDPHENKLMQLIWIFQRVYNLTIEAGKHGDTEAEENAWFESQLPPWDKEEIYLSILPSRQETAYRELGAKLSRRFASVVEGAPLEDLMMLEQASALPIIERNFRRLRNETEEDERVPRLIERLRTSSPWRTLRAESSYWVISQAVQNPKLSRKTRDLAVARMRELAATDSEMLGAICVELGLLLNCRREDRPKEARQRVEALLQEGLASPAFEFWKAPVLQYQAKHRLAQNDFDQAATFFRDALNACSERNFGTSRGEIARDAFATEVANRRLIPGNHEKYYRNMLAYGMFDQGAVSIEDAAVELADYFWGVLYQPYAGVEYQKPLAAKQAEAFIRETFPLIWKADWDGLAAWFKRHAKDFKNKQIRDVRGDTVLMSWLKMRHTVADPLPQLKAMTPTALQAEVAKCEKHLENWRIAIERLTAAWPKQANIPDFKGQTPLMLAVERGDEALTLVLLEHGADLDAQDHIGRTALHAAMIGRSEQCLDALMQHQPDISKATVDGQTALHTAVRMGFRAGVHRVLGYDADIRLKKNSSGQTAKDLIDAILADMKTCEGEMARDRRRIGSRCDYEAISAELNDG